VSRVKVLVNLISGPTLLKGALTWLGLDDTRPLLVMRQVNGYLNRATVPLPQATGGSVEHVEIAFDFANSPMAKRIFHYGYASLPSVQCGLTIVLEGRAADELPERPLARVSINHFDPACPTPPPPCWPTEARAHSSPGVLHGPIPWQSTRQAISAGKSARGGGEVAPPPSSAPPSSPAAAPASADANAKTGRFAALSSRFW